MAFATASDPFVALAMWIGIGAFATAGGLLAAVAVLRARLVGAQRRERAVAARWNPLFAECAEQVPESMPPLAARDAVAFLTLWCRAQESLRGDAQSRLNELATRAGAREHAHRLLRSNHLTHELLAVIALGHLRDAEVMPLLERLIPEAPSVTSICAAQALLRIDAARALPRIIAAAARREDWPLARVAQLLSEADPAVVGRILEAAISSEARLPRPGPGLARMVRLHGSGFAEFLRPVILRILRESADAEAVAAALGVLWHPADVGLARELARHESWTVRVAAARALARLGTREDAALLAGLLADPSWWVRYRAAQALCALPGLDSAAIDALRAQQSDRFAADMLAQAQADRAA